MTETVQVVQAEAPVAYLHEGGVQRELSFHTLTAADKKYGWRETPLYARHEATAGLVEVLREAQRKYPKSMKGLVWFAVASGLTAGEVTQEVHAWADKTIDDALSNKDQSHG